MSEETIDTLFLVGAGTQRKSWDPVIRAISSCPIKGIGDPVKVTCSESATSFFATLVNYRRHLHLASTDPAAEASLRTRARKEEARLAEAHAALKAHIATELRRAVKKGTIRLRAQFLRMVKEYWGKGSVAFLTTNWDPLLENELRRLTREQPRLGYLHGNIANPNLMLLPGEIVPETYRTAADRNRMRKMFSMWNIIEHSRRIVIYGHSVSAIEAELRLMLCMGFSEAPAGEIVIVSRRRDAAQAVRQRVLPLIPPGRHWKIRKRIKNR